ncbi:MAG: ATP-dependent protease LonB [Candidatus Diapherotrites archaeon]|nr:ATP-dependent protease LonB [Candidatus Diapherotrites archaeon]
MKPVESEITGKKVKEVKNGFVYNATTSTGNLFSREVAVSNSGGLGTPAHARVEPGMIHKSNKGVLFIDEMAALSPKAQQELLTALQEKKYSITGQSEMSSGAMVRTEAVPCDFVLVAAGNMEDLKSMHPALRSRIRGYGYEIFMNNDLADTPENRFFIAQFIAQEVKKDGKIPHFSKSAVDEVVRVARIRAGRKGKLTLKLRDLGGLVRAAGDLAKEDKSKKLVHVRHVKEAMKLAKTLEQQVSDKYISVKKDYEVFKIKGMEVGRVNGLAVIGREGGGIVLPIVSEVAPAQSQREGKVIATGKLGDIANEAVQNVSALLKLVSGKDISQFDIHVQFLQTYEGVEGDSASVSVATALLSAMTGVPVNQSIAMTGSLSVRGDVLPVGGVTMKILAALGAGIKTVVIPKSNLGDVVLDDRQKKQIRIVPAETILEVLEAVLSDSKSKKSLIKKLEKALEEVPLKI